MKTSKFEINFGVNPGYSHQNEVSRNDVPAIFQEVIEDIAWETTITVTGIITSTVTVYRESHGCPLGGEKTVAITGFRNPHYCADDEGWRDAVKRVAIALGQHYEQTTVYLSFSEVNFDYLITGVKK
jgi:hypothetical protein